MVTYIGKKLTEIRQPANAPAHKMRLDAHITSMRMMRRLNPKPLPPTPKTSLDARILSSLQLKHVRFSPSLSSYPLPYSLRGMLSPKEGSEPCVDDPGAENWIASSPEASPRPAGITKYFCSCRIMASVCCQACVRVCVRVCARSLSVVYVLARVLVGPCA